MQVAKIAVPTASRLNALSLLLYLGDNFRQLENHLFSCIAWVPNARGQNIFTFSPTKTAEFDVKK